MGGNAGDIGSGRTCIHKRSDRIDGWSMYIPASDARILAEIMGGVMMFT